MGNCNYNYKITNGKLVIIDKNITQEKFEEILKQNPNVYILICNECINLTSIPQLDKLMKLYCNCCTNLTFIPQLDNLIELYCADCTSLTSIPQLDKLTVLDCENCTDLTNISQLDKLTTLHYWCCNSLTKNNIGYLPKLHIINYSSTDFKDFKSRNKDMYNLKVANSPILKLLESKNSGGFHPDLMGMITKMIV